MFAYDVLPSRLGDVNLVVNVSVIGYILYYQRICSYYCGKIYNNDANEMKD